LRAPVLIVDDYPANLIAFREVLSDPRYEIFLAHSGREALALVEKTEFAAILLDVRMPELNGYDTAALMRRRPKSKTTPILFMTAFDAPAKEVTEAYAIGTDFIQKPVEDVVLRSKVSAFVDLYFRQREAMEWGQELADNAQSRLRLIFEQLPVNICTVNRDLRITFADGSNVRARGRAGGALIGMRVTDLAEPAERPKIEAAFQSAVDGRSSAYDTVSDGRVYSAHVQPLCDRDKAIVGAICGYIDITAQKSAEKAAHEQKNLLETLFKTATDAIFVKDHSGRFLLVNESGARSFGKTVEQVVGRTDPEVLPEETARACRESDRRVLETGEPLVTEEQIPLPDGVHTCRVSKAPLRDDSGKPVGIVGIAHDVTDLKEAKERLAELNRGLELQIEERTRALKSSQARLNLALEAAGMGAWDLDTQTQAVQWSDLMFRMLGYEAGSFRPTFEDWTKRIHPEDLDRTMAEVERAKREGGAYGVEYRILRADTGELRWLRSRAHLKLDERGQVGELAGVTCDITELKRADAAQALLAATIESSDDAIITISLDGTITSWNRSAGRIFGYSASEAVGKPMMLIIPEDLRAEEDSLLDRLRRGERIDHFETRRRTKDGKVLNIALTVSPVFDSRGQIIGASKVARDVTGRKRDQEALREALDESNAFAHSVSHELRAPLRAMGQTSEMLLEDLGDKLEETTRFDLQRIVSSAHRLDAMTQDLLSYSKLAHEGAPLESVDPGTVIRDVLDLMREDLERSGAQVSVQAEFASILGNPQLLSHAISNLVYNAIKFVSPGTSPKVALGSERKGEWLRLQVEDNGIGVAPKDRSRLFQVFQRVSKDYPGTGVGLAMVRKCVQRMGGRVGMDSLAGSGSRFWIELPLAHP